MISSEAEAGRAIAIGRWFPSFPGISCWRQLKISGRAVIASVELADVRQAEAGETRKRDGSPVQRASG